MTDKHDTPTLNNIENVTISHYQSSAEFFWQGTRDHDVSQNITAFLNALPADRVLNILDFGCGPGRDLMTFKQMGHRPTGLDGCEAFCRMASTHSGCPVLHQQFLTLNLGTARFDGIFANASMFHVPGQELPGVLKHCYQALRLGGVLFTSNPRGNAEGWQGQRYCHYMEFETNNAVLEQAGFTVLDHYYRPEGMPRDQQPWLAVVSRREN